MKPETRFRIGKVIPFLKTLRHTTFFAIQQLTIVGDPDFMVCIRGRFVALELKKSEKDTPRKIQLYKLREVERTGGLAITAYPENWEQVKSLLRNLDQGEST